LNDLSESFSNDSSAPILNSTAPFDGYTLFAPMADTTTYLIDIYGNVVHTWPSAYQSGFAVYMKDNGNIVRMTNLNLPDTAAGGIQEIAWNGTELWDFPFFGEGYAAHHDIAPMPNGNVLVLAWENKSTAEAIAAGLNPAFIPPDGVIRVEFIVEIQPTGPTTGDIVWEWHVWDHLIQDFDPSKDNYDVVEDHPELMDINYFNTSRKEILHGNGLDYNPELDQIILSCRAIDEFWILGHNSTSSGDILYRWGNPMVYRAGNDSDRQLFGQHDANWIKPGAPGEGNILVFNNGGTRPGVYSTVDEIVPPIDTVGNYSLIPGTAFEPSAPVWTYTAPQPTDFYAQALSGAQRQPDGNTLICHGPDGYFFEVNPAGDKVWEYQNEYPDAVNNRVFKIRKYPTIGHDIPLSEGWNLLSLPLNQTDGSLDKVLEVIDGKWDHIQVFDPKNDLWKTNSTHRPDQLDDLDALNHKSGFWINITEPNVTYTVMGRIPTSNSTTITLKAGWNLVGYPSLTQRTLAVALAGTGYIAVEGFDASNVYRLKTLGDMYMMKPGEGYWVRVPADTNWIVDW